MGLVYGLRAHGPWTPGEGHRFNPFKLLLDSRAKYGDPLMLIGRSATSEDAKKFHVSPRLLQDLNRGRQLELGSELIVPAVADCG